MDDDTHFKFKKVEFDTRHRFVIIHFIVFTTLCVLSAFLIRDLLVHVLVFVILVLLDIFFLFGRQAWKEWKRENDS